jgi:hypothetical protein
MIIYDTNGKYIFEEWFYNDIRHRNNGPAYTLYNGDGHIEEEAWYIDGNIKEIKKHS